MRTKLYGKIQKVSQIVQNEQLTELLTHQPKPSLNDKKNWVALISVENLGPQTFYFIVNYMNKYQISWSDFWQGKHELWKKMMISEKIVKSINSFINEYTIDSYWDWIISKNISILFVTDHQYPFLLRQIDDPPSALFIKGKTVDDEKFPIAVIGSRKMTAYGRMVTEKIVTELVANDAVIISGFMYGVDVRAQETAIDMGGTTIGVLGYGFDYVFPKCQRVLMNKMLESKNATFISEYPPFVHPAKWTFPRRNRIIAGLSSGVVVTEAGLNSGTQITVGYALDYGRDVFAVSGPVTSIYHQGVKSMLNQGAMLVGSGMEVLNNLSAKQWIVNNNCNKKKGKATSQEFEVDSLQRNILEALCIMPLTTHELSKQIKAELSELNKALTSLEINGIVSYKEGYWWTV